MKLYNFREWDATKRAIQLSEWNTDEMIFKREFAKIKSGYVVLDVGSEYGFYAIMAGQLVGSEGKVLAIEAHPETYKLCVMNIKLHGLFDRIIPICKAAGRSTGKLKLYETISPGGSSIVRQSAPSLNKNRFSMMIEFLKSDAFLRVIRKRFAPVKYIVEMDTLDRIANEYGLERIDLIKIDVEGAELDVLEGGFSILTHLKPTLLIEVHFGCWWKPETLYNLLKNLGYKLTIEERSHKALVVAYPEKTGE